MTAIHTPDWVKDAVFYQIFPDRFARGAALELSKPRNLEPWNSPPTQRGYKGGDLYGVLEHLEHIQALGATALYFCPIFQSGSNHRYHTHDYYQVDPLLGGNDAFLRLLDEAHHRGLRVVLDGVFNHASRGFFYFHDVLENGPASPYLDWFKVTEFPINAYDEGRPASYWAWWGLHALPKLNTDNLHVREYLMEVAEHWLRLGVDGWRLDVPQEITTPGFWEEFRERVKAVNKDAYIVGEIWTEATAYLQGTRFDGVMNYLFAEATLAFCGGPRVVAAQAEGKGYAPQRPLTGKDYAARMDWLINLYPWEIQLTQLNLLDSHDTARAITLCGGDEASVRLATLLLMTYPGAPCVFAGDEIGLAGGLPDYNARVAFPWDRPEAWRRDVLACHQALIALRRSQKSLRRGTYQAVFADATAYAFVRRFSGDSLLVVVNTAEEARRLNVPVKDLFSPRARLRALYPPPELPPWGEFEGGRGTGRLNEGVVELTLEPRSGVVIGA
jgi:cyclomaltodextrinase